MRRLSAPGLTGLVVALFAAGCAGTSSPGSPTASSPTGSVTSSSGEGGLLAAQGKGGNGKGNGNGRGHDPGGSGRGNGRGNGPNPPGESNPNPPSAPPANPVTGKAEIEGLIAGIAGLSLTVNGQTVLVPDTAVIRHGSRAILFAELQVGDRVHVKASKLQDGTLEATEVKVQNPVGNPNDDVNDDGSAIVRVAVLDGAAPRQAGHRRIPSHARHDGELACDVAVDGELHADGDSDQRHGLPEPAVDGGVSCGSGHRRCRRDADRRQPDRRT